MKSNICISINPNSIARTTSIFTNFCSFIEIIMFFFRREYLPFLFIDSTLQLLRSLGSCQSQFTQGLN